MNGTVISRGDGAINSRTLLAIFAVALLIRVVNVFWMVSDPIHVLIEDADYYWRGAQAWLDRGPFMHMHSAGKYSPQTERVPLYHIFLIPFRWAFGDNLLPALLGQAGLSAATCVLIAIIIGVLSPIVGVTGGFLAAFWPNLIIHSGMTLGDTLFLFFLSLLLLYSIKYLRGARIRDAAIAGFVCGLATMTRPIAQFLPIALLAAAFLIARWHGKSWRKSIIASVLLLALAITPAIPLLTRNYIKYDTLQLTNQTGTHLLGWMASSKSVQLEGRSFLSVNTELNREFAADAESRNIDLEKLDPFALSGEKAAFALAKLREVPSLDLVQIWLQNAVINLSVPAVLGDPRVRSLKSGSFYNLEASGFIDRIATFLGQSPKAYLFWVIGGGIFAVFSLVLQIFGFYILFRTTRWGALFALLFIFYFLLLNGPVSLPKYRLPYEPILIAFQALAMHRVWGLIRSRYLGRQSI